MTRLMLYIMALTYTCDPRIHMLGLEENRSLNFEGIGNLINSKKMQEKFKTNYTMGETVSTLFQASTI